MRVLHASQAGTACNPLIIDPSKLEIEVRVNSDYSLQAIKLARPVLTRSSIRLQGKWVSSQGKGVLNWVSYTKGLDLP